MEYTRFVHLCGDGLSQSDSKYQLGFQRFCLFGLCGFIFDGTEDVGKRYQTSKCNCLYKRNTPHWSETKKNFIICAALSLQDPKSQAFVNDCLRHPDFVMFIKKGEKGRVIGPKGGVGATLVRQASTRAGLKRTPWEKAEETTCFVDAVLENCPPRISATEIIEDCYHIAIVDCGEGEIKDFVEKIVQIWLKVYGMENFWDLLGAIADVYIKMGELQLSEGVVKSREEDILKSYKLLWGRGPHEGNLADDELDVVVRLSLNIMND